MQYHLHLHYDFLTNIGMILFFTLLSSCAAMLLHRMVRRAIGQDRGLYLQILTAFSPVLKYTIPIVGLTYLVPEITSYLLQGSKTLLAVGDSMPTVRSLAIDVSIAIGFWRLIRSLEDKYLALRNDKTSVQVIANAAKITVMLSLILSTLGTLGISLSALLAFGGAAGVVAAISLKDTLSNVFGYFYLIHNSLIRVGDWVYDVEETWEGTITKIHLQYTEITQFDKRKLYIPNGQIAQSKLVNASRMTSRRIKEHIGIRYSDAPSMKAIIREIKDMLQEDCHIDTDQTNIVNFDRFGESDLSIMLYCYTYTRDWEMYHKVKQDLLLKILEIIQKHGADCAFPTRTIHMH